MLYTNLHHLESALDLGQLLLEKSDVLVVCGRMDPRCVTAYRIAETLEKEYSQVQFCDMEFDHPELQSVRQLPEIETLKDLPIAIYFKRGVVADATSDILTTPQLRALLDKNKLNKL
jgi:thioredoxin 1